MPMWQVDMYAAALPRLEAQEQMTAIETVSLPDMKPHERDAVLRRIGAAMRGPEASRRPTLGEMGLPIIEEPKGGARGRKPRKGKS